MLGKYSYFFRISPGSVSARESVIAVGDRYWSNYHKQRKEIWIAIPQITTSREEKYEYLAIPHESHDSGLGCWRLTEQIWTMWEVFRMQRLCLTRHFFIFIVVFLFVKKFTRQHLIIYHLHNCPAQTGLKCPKLHSPRLTMSFPSPCRRTPPRMGLSVHHQGWLILDENENIRYLTFIHIGYIRL